MPSEPCKGASPGALHAVRWDAKGQSEEVMLCVGTLRARAVPPGGDAGWSATKLLEVLIHRAMHGGSIEQGRHGRTLTGRDSGEVARPNPLRRIQARA
jgi:hypothetical protein